MTTLVVDQGALGGDEIEVAAERFHHLFRVRRLREGDRIRLVNGQGRARWGRVVSVGRRSARVRVEGPAPDNEAAERVELVVAAPRPQRAGWLVEKATEVGVHAVRFVTSERSPRRYGPATHSRLHRLAVAAVEQCGRSLVPAISGVHPWEEIGGLLESATGRWVLEPGVQPSLPSLGGSGSWAIAVGPEGGWSEDEVRQLSDLGCRAVSLGPRTLRVETAAIVAAAALVTRSVDTL